MGQSEPGNNRGTGAHVYSEAFYRDNARRYSEVASQFLQSIYIKSSHPALKGDLDLLERLQELAKGPRGLDTGCGAGARDVHFLWQAGRDIYGIDAVEENILLARELHPGISDRVSVADLKVPLSYPDHSFDFVMCNAVIQHIPPEHVFGVTLGELARVLGPRGVLQIMFKCGWGVVTVHDRDYGVDRSFQLYDAQEVLGALETHGLELVEAEGPGGLGGVMYFTAPKPMEHCVFYVRRNAG